MEEDGAFAVVLGGDSDGGPLRKREEEPKLRVGARRRGSQRIPWETGRDYVVSDGRVRCGRR